MPMYFRDSTRASGEAWQFIAVTSYVRPTQMTRVACDERLIQH